MPQANQEKSICLTFIVFMISTGILPAQDSTEKKSEFLPEINVILKTKAEFDLNNSLMRFEVRNARFGLKGKINNYFSYKAELDLSDEGKFKVLDTYIKFTPFSNLDFYLGQRKIPFSSDYLRNPAENIFANRSFLAKYINDGMRDIGFYAEYKMPGDIPVNFLFGAVNGTGNNNPQWISKPNLVGRIIAGPEKGFRAIFNTYSGKMQYEDHLSMYGGEMRYTDGTWFIESEYIYKSWTDTTYSRNHDDGIYIHSYYNIHINSRMICLLTPAARWDMMGVSVFSGKADAERITLGINAGFEPKQFYSEIRLNFEKYLKRSLPIHTDKISLEFVARF